MKNLTKGLAQAWLMLIALFAFQNETTEKERETGALRLSKPISKGGGVDILIKTPKGNPDHKCQVSIFNRSTNKEVFKWFNNAYDAAKYIVDGHANTELFDSFRRVSQELGPFSFELQQYFAMITTEDKREFITIDAVNSSDATEQIKTQIITLLNLDQSNDQTQIDVKLMNSTDAKAFAGYIMAS